MRRAPIVLGATVVGLVGVLSFHTSPPALSLGVGALSKGTSDTPVAPGSAGASSPTTSAPPPSGSTAAPPPSASGGGGTTTPSTTAPAATTRSATGSDVNYDYGSLAVQVTVTGTKISNVKIATIDDGGNPRSVFIDQQAIPVLEQEAIQAQSANIQGVSGASYTSEGFQQSLQSALGKLGL